VYIYNTNFIFYKSRAITSGGCSGHLWGVWIASQSSKKAADGALVAFSVDLPIDHTEKRLARESKCY